MHFQRPLKVYFYLSNKTGKDSWNIILVKQRSMTRKRKKDSWGPEYCRLHSCHPVYLSSFLSFLSCYALHNKCCPPYKGSKTRKNKDFLSYCSIKDIFVLLRALLVMVLLCLPEGSQCFFESPQLWHCPSLKQKFFSAAQHFFFFQFLPLCLWICDHSGLG